MRKSTAFLLLIISLATSLTFSSTYKLTHPKENPMPGFFSIFNTVLGALDYYENSKEIEGLIVDFGKLGHFFDPSLSENWWEYYFEPIKLGTSDNQTIEFKAYKKIIFSFFAQLKMSRDRGCALITKYIKLKPHIQNKVSMFLQNYFEGNTVIGLHYRGTDKSIEAPNVTYEAVGEVISKEVEAHKTIKIFVATDDENFLTYMYTNFPGKIIALQAIRSKDKKPVHSNNDENPYQKGEDALLDCLLLSHCSKIYKTASNLSDVAIKFNPNIPVVHLSRHFSEATYFDKYNFFKVFNSILLSLDLYENDNNAGFTAYFPTKDTNWWENNFEPLSVGTKPSNLQLTDIDITILGFTGIFELDSHKAHELISKYIRIKPHVFEKIDELYNKHLNNAWVLNIFYMKEKDNDYKSYNEIIFEAHKALQKAPTASKILLITNDETLLMLLNKEFSNIVNPINPQWSLLSGEAELLLTLMMARADCIVGTRSIYLNVAKQFNPNVPIIALGEYWLEQ